MAIATGVMPKIAVGIMAMCALGTGVGSVQEALLVCAAAGCLDVVKTEPCVDVAVDMIIRHMIIWITAKIMKRVWRFGSSKVQSSSGGQGSSRFGVAPRFRKSQESFGVHRYDSNIDHGRPPP